jgi:hypothetical protein
MFHNHNAASGSLSTFSAEDIKAFSIYVAHDKTTDPASFIFGLTTAQGTTYALVIEDMAKFTTFWNDIINNSNQNNWINYNNVIALTVKPTNTEAVNERALLVALNNKGIALLKSNSAQSQWGKLSLNSSFQVVVNNCD